MIVCVCNGVREAEVRAAAREGCSTPCRVYAFLGHVPRCGACVPFARDLIQQEARA